jgi:glycosyltransferase involved in cell wall biosynthesis
MNARRHAISGLMRIGLDVAQTCVERHGCGWVADRIATAVGNVCSGDQVILYHQFGEWLNRNPSEGTLVARSNVSAPFMGSSWLSASIAWKKIEAGRSNLPSDPDIVHSFSFQAPIVGSARLVYTVHDLSFWTHPEFTTEANRLSCQRGLLNALHRASALVFVSENSRNDFFSLLNCSDRVRALPSKVIPLASRFPGLAEARAGHSSGPWLSVGALEPRKNIDLLLDAFEIYQSHSNCRRKLCLAGGKGWKSEATWKRIAGLQRRGVVEHRGYVSDNELVRLYNEAFGFVFPSHYEGFGLPVLESMSQACPVICSKNSSLPEVGGEAVLYWDGESAETLAGSMLGLEHDETLYRQLSESGLERSRSFSWENAALALRTFYDRVCNLSRCAI